MQAELKRLFPHFWKSLSDSYSQVFFSQNQVLALLVMVGTFLNPWAGLAGLLSALIANTAAYVIGFNRFNIRNGYYGFNALLVGLGLGVAFKPSPELYLLLFFCALLTLLLTLLLEGVIGKYGLPYLSLPFLISFWLVLLSAGQFHSLTLNSLHPPLTGLNAWLENLHLPEPLAIYFKSLGAIFFQYSLSAGLLIALGVLLFSRISLLLSLIGFFSAYYFYHLIGADFSTLSYDYIGFNFLLTAMAIGGFFTVPSWSSFLWIILLTPLIAILLSAGQAILAPFLLSVYSLPFNAIVLLFIYALKFRERFFHRPQMILVQQFSPEKNLYAHLNSQVRFRAPGAVSVALPFLSEWVVAQGHEGEFTHRDQWRHAWDFVLHDENQKACSGSGEKRKDHYCFDKPILAPADGVVEEIRDDVEDNEIGRPNLEQNWGNTIILKHAESLYSQLSHLRQASLKVAVGDAVKKGDVLAACGNSGRSPTPHLHFQLQSTPFIGSRTLDYPLGHYILKNGSNYQLRTCDRPRKGDLVSNIEINPVLRSAFHFIPGQEFNIKVISPRSPQTVLVTWEVKADLYNLTYLYCRITKSKAYFYFDGEIHYFTHFEGDRKSLLYYFFLGSFKMMSGFYRNFELEDAYPLSLIGHPLLLAVQDFAAPFHVFLQANYHLDHLDIDDIMNTTRILMRSSMQIKIGPRVIDQLRFDLHFNRKGLDHFIVTGKNVNLEAVWVQD